MGAPYSKTIRTLDQGGDRRTVTATYRYGATAITIVRKSRAEANEDALRRWGQWDGEPVYSTPRSIYNDLTGATQRRTARRGMYTYG